MWPSGLSFFERCERVIFLTWLFNCAEERPRDYFSKARKHLLQSAKISIRHRRLLHMLGVSTQHAVENWGGKKKKKTFWEDGVKSIINIPQIWKWSCDSSDNYILSFGSSQRHYVPSSCWLSKMTSRQNDLPLLFWSIRQVFLLSGLFSNFRMVWVHFRAVLLLLMMLINIPARQNWRLFKRS